MDTERGTQNAPEFLGVLDAQRPSGDFDANGTVDLDDFEAFVECFAGPSAAPDPMVPGCAGACLAAFEYKGNGAIELADFAEFQRRFQSP